jgi:hypothetical protein
MNHFIKQGRRNIMNRRTSWIFKGLLPAILLVGVTASFAQVSVKYEVRRAIAAAVQQEPGQRITTDDDLLSDAHGTGNYNPSLALLLSLASQDAYSGGGWSFHAALSGEGFRPALAHAEVSGSLRGMYGGVCEKKVNGKQIIAIGFRGTVPNPTKEIDLIDDLDARQHMFPISYCMPPDTLQADFIQRVKYMELGMARYNPTFDYVGTVGLPANDFDKLNILRKSMFSKENLEAYRDNYECFYQTKNAVVWPTRSHCGFTTQLLDFMRQEDQIKLNDGRTLFNTLAHARRNPSAYHIIVYGHSLGGAVAKLYACELIERGLRPTVYTYGAPPIGNRALTDRYFSRMNVHEFVHPRDLVAGLTDFLDELMPPLNLIADKLAGWLVDFPERNYAVNYTGAAFDKERPRRNGSYNITHHDMFNYMTRAYRQRHLARGKKIDSLTYFFADLLAEYGKLPPLTSDDVILSLTPGGEERKRIRRMLK